MSEQNGPSEVKVTVRDLGLIDYAEALRIQQQAVASVRTGAGPFLFLCEHPVVITSGRSSSPEHIYLPDKELQSLGIQRCVADRGGDVTLHAPGQLVIYPILNLSLFQRDIRWYLSKLEQVAIDLLGVFDILTVRCPGRTGVWFGTQKIASLGIGIRQWVTSHGMSINININLNLFKIINPCGLSVEMTSMQAIKGQFVEQGPVKAELVRTFCQHFTLIPVEIKAGDRP